MHYKPMGNIAYIISQQGGGLIMCVGLHTNIPYKSFERKSGWAYNISRAYNTYYTVIY